MREDKLSGGKVAAKWLLVAAAAEGDRIIKAGYSILQQITRHEAGLALQQEARAGQK